MTSTNTQDHAQDQTQDEGQIRQLIADQQSAISAKDPDRKLSSRVLQDDGSWKRFMTATYRRRK